MSRRHPHAGGSKPAIPWEIIDVDSWVPPPTEIIDVDAWQPTPKKKKKKPLPPGQLLLTSNLGQLGIRIDQHSLARVIPLARTASSSRSSTVIAYDQLFVNGIPQQALNTADNTFTCSICQQLLANAVGLPCGKTICHVFCFYCLHRWLYESQGKGCPLCRTEIKNPPTRMKNLEAALKSLPSYKNYGAKVVWNKAWDRVKF
ncbi:hypothetical protein B0H14DRAFT_2647443 [Mycena olivaceomarginata]|nr:hypothetical protein B0H14DRAFT_2647443 [Mycena olivaceomarginata]